MHETFVFPMECYGQMERWDRGMEIKEYKGNQGIFGGGNTRYNPFNYDNLIPEFIDLIQKTHNGGNLEKHLIRWHSEWGPLYFDFNKNTVENFSVEAERFYALWNLFKAIANKDLEGMKNHSKIEIDEELTKLKGEFQYVITFFSEDPLFEREIDSIAELNKQLGKRIFPEFKNPEFSFRFKPTDDQETLLKHYQEASMMFLFRQIENYTNRVQLTYGSMNHEEFEGMSNFTIKPQMYVENLIDAIYMQLYILFTENQKKICPICNKPFLPKRKDQKYCTNTIDESKPSPCYLTAKSRRYRKRKEEHTK